MDTSVSILIPAWNEEKIIKKTIKWLNKLNLPFNYSEIIFIAGGDDKTYETCKNLKLTNFNSTITIKQESSDFKTGALIKGIIKAKGKIITLIDADVFVAPNLMEEIAKSLKKFDVVCCNYIPMMNKGFWRNYYTLRKEIWSNNPNKLKSLIGGATISLNSTIFDEISIKDFFSNKTTAGVDYYMGLVLKEHNKKIGFVKNTRVLMPRPNNLRDFLKDQTRWLTAFYNIHQKDKTLIASTFILNILFCICPLVLLLFSVIKIKKLSVISGVGAREYYRKLGYKLEDEYMVKKF